ncbi:hypothetical protein ACQKWADRAFT_309143 [Trichoderma austrokoningii]
MADEAKQSFNRSVEADGFSSPNVKTYIRDDDELQYRLMVISNSSNNQAANEGASTGAGQHETKAADRSPISDAGTWEIVNRGDAN